MIDRLAGAQARSEAWLQTENSTRPSLHPVTSVMRLGNAQPLAGIWLQCLRRSA